MLFLLVYYIYDLLPYYYFIIYIFYTINLTNIILNSNKLINYFKMV